MTISDLLGRAQAPKLTASDALAMGIQDKSEAGRHFYYQVSDTVLTHGRGVYVYDQDGQALLDAASGTFNLSLGYSHPEIVEVVREQAGQLIHASSSFQVAAVNDLVERLVHATPVNLTRIHLKVASGTGANEGAIKIAQHHTGGRDVITLFRSHLGQSLHMAALSGNAFRTELFESLPVGSVKMPDPYCARCFYRQEPRSCGLLCAERMRDFIEYAGSGRTACVIVEPISGNGGNIASPAGYLQRLRRISDEYGVLLVFDEIQTGFGRTGHMFAADHFGVSPDILTFGKGLGGSGLQVAGLATEERLVGLPGDAHSFTYGANPLACAAGAKTLEILQRPGFLLNVRRQGDRLMGALRRLAEDHRFLGEVRGVGLMIGFEIVDETGEPDVARTHRVVEEARTRGLLLRTSRYGRGNVIKIRPPLIIGDDESAELIAKLDLALEAVAS